MTTELSVRTAFVGSELPPRELPDKGEVFGLRIFGPAVVELLENQMHWEEYQG